MRYIRDPAQPFQDLATSRAVLWWARYIKAACASTRGLNVLACRTFVTFALIDSTVHVSAMRHLLCIQWTTGHDMDVSD